MTASRPDDKDKRAPQPALPATEDLDPATASDALKAWCREQLAGYKCPRSISFTDALPLSAAGKLLKTTLRAAHRP